MDLDYGRVTPLLTKAIQDQQVEIEALKAANEDLRATAAKIGELVETSFRNNPYSGEHVWPTQDAASSTSFANNRWGTLLPLCR